MPLQLSSNAGRTPEVCGVATIELAIEAFLLTAYQPVTHCGWLCLEATRQVTTFCNGAVVINLRTLVFVITFLLLAE